MKIMLVNVLIYKTKGVIKRRVQKIIISLFIVMFLFTNALGQEEIRKIKKTKEARSVESYLDPVLNMVSTDFNYGKSNGVLTDYKRTIWGAQAGVSFQAGVTPAFSLVPELYFIMKGGKLKKKNPLTESELTARLYALELPVLARFHVGRFYINAGPSTAYNFYGTLKTGGSTSDLRFRNSNGGIRRFEASAQMGAGYRFKIKHKSVVLDIRYVYGLTNASYNMEMYNRYFILNIRFSRLWRANPLEIK